MRLTWVPLLALAAVAPAGCFNPDLGDTPFRCAVTGKACPDGYRCNSRKICIPEDQGDDAQPDLGPGDGSGKPSKEGPVFLDGHPPKDAKGCVDDSTEPNNTSATATSIPSAGALPGWDICYAGDIDHFVVNLSSGGKLSVKIKFYHKKGDLDAALLDPDGQVISTSRSADDNEELSVSTVTKAGKYIFAVWGFGGAVNTYDLEVTF